MAGINIVSAYITMVAIQLNIPSVFHAESGIFIGWTETLDELEREAEEDCELVESFSR